MSQLAEPKGRILVAEDDASLAEMLSIVLRQEGFEVELVDRGDEAVDAFRSYRPDLVLLDLMLPGMDGIEVCKQIRHESGIPIVMLTAKGDTVDVVVGLESGADDYVVKPFKPKELIAAPASAGSRRPGPSSSRSATSPSTSPRTR
jgi:two-component system, OmpR family, response regulator MtrA